MGGPPPPSHQSIYRNVVTRAYEWYFLRPNRICTNQALCRGCNTPRVVNNSAKAMYSAKDAPSRSLPGNGKSYIDFDLQLERDNTQGAPVFIELIVIPDININDIGVKEGGNLHLCCNPELFEKYGCSEKTIGELITPKPITGLYREKIPMEGASYHFKGV